MASKNKIIKRADKNIDRKTWVAWFGNEGREWAETHLQK